MNIWHEMDSEKVSTKKFTAVIEISKGSQMKYELDKATGLLRLDRILHTSTHYPANYGFIPRTLAEDHDPLDVLVLCSHSILPLTLVDCFPIGMINMTDSGEADQKIIAVPCDDPTYKNYKKIEELPGQIFSEMSHFFEVYKALEGKETLVEGVTSVEKAKETIQKCIDVYKENFEE